MKKQLVKHELRLMGVAIFSAFLLVFAHLILAKSFSHMVWTEYTAARLVFRYENGAGQLVVLQIHMKWMITITLVTKDVNDESYPKIFETSAQNDCRSGSDDIRGNFCKCC